jgi:AraC family transcriptional regulator, regulatory protein of adaptative response / methylphosphotriester-DNA alkyltransferase methyltransferase
MRRAHELLSAGSAPVRDVAMTVGYRQPAQSAKACRRHHGVSPYSLRRGDRAEPERRQPEALSA